MIWLIPGICLLSSREKGRGVVTHDNSVKDFSISTKFLTRRATNVEIIARTFTHCGEIGMVSKSKSLVIIKFCSHLITRMM